MTRHPRHTSQRRTLRAHWPTTFGPAKKSCAETLHIAPRDGHRYPLSHLRRLHVVAERPQHNRRRTAVQPLDPRRREQRGARVDEHRSARGRASTSDLRRGGCSGGEIGDPWLVAHRALASFGKGFTFGGDLVVGGDAAKPQRGLGHGQSVVAGGRRRTLSRRAGSRNPAGAPSATRLGSCIRRVIPESRPDNPRHTPLHHPSPRRERPFLVGHRRTAPRL